MGDEGRPLGVLPQELQSGAYRLLYRLPESRDLMAVERCGKPQDAYWLLLDKCVLLAEHAGNKVVPPELPREVREHWRPRCWPTTRKPKCCCNGPAPRARISGSSCLKSVHSYGPSSRAGPSPAQ